VTVAHATPQAMSFTGDVAPLLAGYGVEVEDVRNPEGSGELHVTLHLPSDQRSLREKVLSALSEFEERWDFTVTVFPVMLYPHDRDAD
jgi:hypothetical protein